MVKQKIDINEQHTPVDEASKSFIYGNIERDR